MKDLYHFFHKTILAAALLVAFNTSTKAQTTLAAGDIAFSGYTSTTTDEFSFVLMKNISAGTIINFTDNGWLNGTNPAGFRSGETTITLTTNAAFSAGTEIRINGMTATLFASAISAGTVTGTALSLSVNGDQILVYQGSVALPTFITAIHMNVYTTVVGDPVSTTAAGWDPDGGGAAGAGGTPNGSAIPPGLTNGVDAIWIGTQDVQLSEYENARFVCGPDVSSAALARAALNDQTNWTLRDQGFLTGTAPSFTLPSNCSFIGIPPLAVQLTSFTGTLNPNKTTSLQWIITQQNLIREFIVEKSTDGTIFRQIGTVAARSGSSASYSYVDMQVATGNNFYRIRTVEQVGKISVSNIVAVNLKADVSLLIYPNPVKDKLVIQQYGGIKTRSATLYNSQGRLLQQVSITREQQPVDMSTYAPGIYILKLEDGTLIKIMK